MFVASLLTMKSSSSSPILIWAMSREIQLCEMTREIRPEHATREEKRDPTYSRNEQAVSRMRAFTCVPQSSDPAPDPAIFFSAVGGYFSVPPPELWELVAFYLVSWTPRLGSGIFWF